MQKTKKWNKTHLQLLLMSRFDRNARLAQRLHCFEFVLFRMVEGIRSFAYYRCTYRKNLSLFLKQKIDSDDEIIVIL